MLVEFELQNREQADPESSQAAGDSKPVARS